MPTAKMPLMLSYPAPRSISRVLFGGMVATMLLGCQELSGTQPLPAGTNDPSFYHTEAGALQMRNAVVYALEQFALPDLVLNAGLLTDELTAKNVGTTDGTLNITSFPAGGSLDERILPEFHNEHDGNGLGTVENTYTELQGVRSSSTQAIGALAVYDSASNSPLLRGELYALYGYSEILLADFFCSGVPLSTLDFDQDYTLKPSATTSGVYQDAIAKFDTAMLLAGTNSSIVHLAQVLKGRALLDLGRYTDAAQAVADVPDGYQYQMAIQWTPAGSTTNKLLDVATVADREGGNGLPFISSNDPRTGVINGGNYFGIPLYFPNKYSTTGFSAFTVSDWIEARLIEAEAALQAHDTTTWLNKLNTLRATATVAGQTGTPSPLTDPGSSVGDSARVSLMFQERGYWLFLTGHRQGDLRRLIRQYGRNPSAVYPVGVYLAPGPGQYGSDVTAPIPTAELTNPLFHGCLNRGA